MTTIVLELAALFLGTGLLSAVLTWVLIRYSVPLKLTAPPAADRWHKIPTPSSGGVAILLACGFVYISAFRGQFTPIAVGALVLGVLGFVDDRLKLKPLPKLAIQIGVAGWMIASGYVFPASPWPVVNAAFSLVWIIGITNAFNLIDNMDGLCAGVTIITAVFRIGIGIGKGFTTEAGLFAVIAGGFAGFLLFNYKPARIFMGDTGSMLAGFTLATLSLASPLAHTKVLAAELAYPALTFLYPIFDTTLVSVLRRAAGRPISVGGRDHSSHRLASMGMSERKVVWILWLLTALGGFAGLLIQWLPLVVVAAAALLVLLLTSFGIFLATLPSYALPIETTVLGDSRLRKWVPSLRAAVTVLVDVLIAGIALFLAFLLRGKGALSPVQISVFLYALPAMMFCHGLFCLLGRVYAITWGSFSRGDAMRLFSVISVSAILAYGIMEMFGIRNFPRGTLLIYVVLCEILSVALRISLRVFQDMFAGPIHEAGHRRVAIFGLSTDSEVFARFVSDYPALGVKPVLFIDYDTVSDGMKVRAIPVRCCRGRLVELAAKFRLDAVVIPCGSSNPRISLVESECSAMGLEIEFARISFDQKVVPRTLSVSN